MTNTQKAALENFLTLLLGEKAKSLRIRILEDVDSSEAFLVSKPYSIISHGIDRSHFVNQAAMDDVVGDITASEARIRSIETMEMVLNIAHMNRSKFFKRSSENVASVLVNELGNFVIQEFFTSLDATKPEYLALMDAIKNNTDTPVYTTDGIIVREGLAERYVSVINAILRFSGSLLTGNPMLNTHDFIYGKLTEYDNGSELYLDTWIKMIAVLEEKLLTFKRNFVTTTTPIDPQDQQDLWLEYFTIFRLFVTFVLIHEYLSV